MATTTNYGWTTPDDTALVKDGASAIRSLGTSVDTTTKNLNPSTTLGDIEYRSSTANTNTRLGIGSTGQVLTVAGGVPSWATPAGGGKVLQVVQATYSTAISSSSSSFTDTGLTASITPTSATSKVLVFIGGKMQKSSGNADNSIALRLVRGSTNLITNTALYTASTLTFQTSYSLVYQDNPATTASTTYKLQIASENNTASVAFMFGSETATIVLMEIGA